MTASTLPVRTRLAGMSMIAGGFLLGVPPLLGPPNDADTTREHLEYLTTHHIQNWKTLCFQAAVLLILPGVIAVVGRVRDRGAFAVVSGGVVYAAGIVGAFSFVLLEGIQVSIANSGPITDDVIRATDAGGDAGVAMPMYVLTFLCFHLIGLPWLSWGLVRARQIPWGLALLATLGTVAAFMGSGTPVEAAGWVVTGSALALISARTLLPRRAAAEKALVAA